MDRRLLVLVLGLALAVPACGDDDGGDTDAGARDGGGIDAGARDAGGDGDSGALDAGESDAGELDAGELDAGESDAGESDAGESDAGESDAGTDGGARLCTAGGGACDVALQDCPTDEACYFAEVGGVAATRCELVFEPGAEGDRCDTVDECGPGLTCRARTCRRYCCPDAALDCPSGQACVRIAEAPNLGHCAPPDACTLAPNAGCSAGSACYPGATAETVGCFGAGSIPEGGTCAAVNACAPGTICLGADTPFTCLRVCRTAMGDADCDAPHVCNAVPGYLASEYGVCDVP